MKTLRLLQPYKGLNLRLFCKPDFILSRIKGKTSIWIIFFVSVSNFTRRKSCQTWLISIESACEASRKSLCFISLYNFDHFSDNNSNSRKNEMVTTTYLLSRSTPSTLKWVMRKSIKKLNRIWRRSPCLNIYMNFSTRLIFQKSFFSIEIPWKKLIFISICLFLIWNWSYWKVQEIKKISSLLI